MKKVFLFLSVCLILTSCWESEPDPVILLDDSPQINVQGATGFKFDEKKCQLAVNREKAEFRMHTDNMSEYVILDLDVIPAEAGGQVTAESLSWTSDDDVQTRKNIVLEVLKLEDDTIWFWYPRERIAIVVRNLE